MPDDRLIGTSIDVSLSHSRWAARRQSLSDEHGSSIDVSLSHSCGAARCQSLSDEQQSLIDVSLSQSSGAARRQSLNDEQQLLIDVSLLHFPGVARRQSLTAVQQEMIDVSLPNSPGAARGLFLNDEQQLLEKGTSDVPLSPSDISFDNISMLLSCFSGQELLNDGDIEDDTSNFDVNDDMSLPLSAADDASISTDPKNQFSFGGQIDPTTIKFDKKANLWQSDDDDSTISSYHVDESDASVQDTNECTNIYLQKMNRVISDISRHQLNEFSASPSQPNVSASCYMLNLFY